MIEATRTPNGGTNVSVVSRAANPMRRFMGRSHRLGRLLILRHPFGGGQSLSTFSASTAFSRVSVNRWRRSLIGVVSIGA